MAQKFTMPGFSAHEHGAHETPAPSKKASRSWYARTALSVSVVGLVLFMLPVAWFPMQIGKLALVSLCFLVAALYVLRARSAGELWRLPGAWVAGVSMLLPIAYLVSLIFSVDPSLGWVGFSFDLDTVALAVLSSSAFVLAWSILRTPRATRSFAHVLGGTLVVAVVAQCVIVLLGGTLLPSLFNDRSINLIGKWNDFALLAALLSLWASARLASPQAQKPVWVAALVASGALLCLANFALAWYLLIVGTLLLLAIRGFGRRGKGLAVLAPALLLVLAVAGLLWGTQINRVATSFVPLASLEVRPSFASSMSAAQASHPSLFRTIVGSGPNTFREAWLAGRSLEVRQSPFWNLDFTVGFSTLVTAFATVGVLGVLAWLVLPLALLLGAWRLWRTGKGAVEGEEETLLLLGGSAALLFAAILFYVPSQNVIVLTYLCAGAVASMLWRATSSETAYVPAHSPVAKVTYLVPSILFVLILATLAGVSVRRSISESFTNQGLIALSVGEVQEALDSSEKALKVEKSGNALRLLLDAGAARVQQIAREPNSTEAQNRFVATLTPTIEGGKEALMKHPRDYRSYFSLGRLYAFLATLGITGAEGSARESLTVAAALNPTSPEIPLFRARFEASQGKGAEAEAQLQKALELKPNYTDAILFVVQLHIANRNLSGALVAAQSAIESDPTNAGLYFQLGLLHYAGGDTAGAIAPLEQAVQLVSTYANAQYFLGLSYYAEGRAQEATALFESLAQSNPENTEVRLILSNIKLGAPPFEGATPPLTDNPETRQTAPIAE